jgi:alpha-ketoglutarate-dependent taurine dioxygenase
MVNNAMSVTYLDCSNEAGEIQPTGNPRMRWLAGDISPDDWIVEVSPAALDEIDQLAEYLQQNPLPTLQRRIEGLPLTACREVMAHMKAILDDGVGFAVFDRMPMDVHAYDTLVQVYWLLGQCISRPVAQKWNGEMIYQVTDTGAEYAYGTRGSRTSVELNFHTDNAFARMRPDYVGLFCRQPAKTGGISRFCSLYSVHERMLEQFPEELARLYQPVFYDRQKEHAEGAAPVSLAPYFGWRNGRMFARANASLIRKGYEVAEKQMDALLIAALDAIDEICAAPDLWFEASLQRGQIQYLNNQGIGHYRSAFEDHDDPDHKRHLCRLWHREAGDSSYDGVGLDQLR